MCRFRGQHLYTCEEPALELVKMTDDLGFTYKQLSGGEVLITHHGKRAATLRKDKARWFLEDMEGLDFESQQQEMARLTGNYRRGNERTAKSHPRNR